MSEERKIRWDKLTDSLKMTILWGKLNQDSSLSEEKIKKAGQDKVMKCCNALKEIRQFEKFLWVH